MLPGAGFDHAVQSVPDPTGRTADQAAGHAATAMAEYYPMGVLCTTAMYEAGGADACFGG